MCISVVCSNFISDFLLTDQAELPPPLLVVRGCEGFDLQIGGFPYRLLLASTGGRYVIRSIDTGENIGEYPSKIFISWQSHQIYFHLLIMFSAHT